MHKSISEVVLHFQEGENEGVEIRVSPPRELSVGRSEECDIFLGEKKVSRNHCRILVSKDEVRIHDLQSTNGTFLNSKKVTKNTIQTEDKIRIGTNVIRVVIDTEAASDAREVSETVAKKSPPPKPKAAKKKSVVKKTEPVEILESSHRAIDLVDPDEVSEEINIVPVAEELDPAELDLSEAQPSLLTNTKTKTLSGNLSAMGLADLLQNLAQNRQSGKLKIQSDVLGIIYIQTGEVVGSELGKVTGLKALYRMLGWTKGEFTFSELPDGFDASSLENGISEPVETLLMEGYRQFDELEKLSKGLPSRDAKLDLKPGFTAPLSKLHPRVLDILQVVINEKTFGDVLDKSALSDLETAKVIFYLVKKEYIAAK